MLRIDKDLNKEAANTRKHGLDFTFADLMFRDPLAVEVYDRFEAGEHRWHTLSRLGGKLLLVAYSYPDPDDLDWVRVISLREATRDERRRYEQGPYD